MLRNHKRAVKVKSGKLSEYDVNYMYTIMNEERQKANQIKKANGETKGFNRPFPMGSMPEKYRFSVTRVTTSGICADCNQERCTSCNGCFIDIFKADLEQHHCQRCICDNSYQSEEPLNNTGTPLEELVRHRQGKKKVTESKMTKFNRNCKFCNKEIIVSNEEDGFFHAFELTNDLHKCRNRDKRN